MTRPRLVKHAAITAAMLLPLLIAAPAWPADDDNAPATVYRQYVDAFSRGQLDAALQYFSDDAIVIAGPNCTQSSPCIGKAAIRERYLAALMTLKLAAPLRDQRSDGERLRTYGETSYVIGPEHGMTRLKGGHTFDFSGGRISSLTYALDLSDVETARFVAQMAAQARLAKLVER